MLSGQFTSATTSHHSAAAFTAPGARTVHLEYVTNPYGRTPPHILVFQDGRVESMTPEGQPVAGYLPGTLVVELLGTPGAKPTETQLQALRDLTAERAAAAKGNITFTGDTDLLVTAKPAFKPEAPKKFRMSSVQEIFDILETPSTERNPLRAGTLFNVVSTSADPANLTSFPIQFPLTREITTLVVVASHSPFQPEPTDASAFTIDTLRKIDKKNGLPDFRGHYLISRAGDLIPGRNVEQPGAAVPGHANGSLQVILAGNGKAPTSDQRRMLLQFGELARKHYDPQRLKVVTRDVVYAKELLGVGPTGEMDPSLVRPEIVTAALPVAKPAPKR